MFVCILGSGSVVSDSTARDFGIFEDVCPHVTIMCGYICIDKMDKW